MEVGNYPFHRRAWMAFIQLPAEEQAEVLEKLASLVGTPAAQLPAGQAKKLPGDQSLYLVQVNDSLRLFLKAAENQKPEVMDFVRRETLESFTKAAAQSGY